MEAATLSIFSLRKVEQKIKDRLLRIKDEAFSSSNFDDFKQYVGVKDGLEVALFILEEVEKEINGA